MTQATNTQAARTFESDLFGSLHTFTDTNGAPWFVGRQVAETLGYGRNDDNISYTLRTQCPDRSPFSRLFENLEHFTQGLPQGVRRNSVLISEGDLYRLVLNSTLDSAQAFQDWVVREVLPSIRHHGGFNVEQASMADQYADPELFQRMNNMHSEFTEFVRNQTAMNTQILSTLATITEAVVGSQPRRELRRMEEGHVTLDELYSLIGGVISRDAFRSLLRGARWPRGSYERGLEDGRVIELSSYPTGMNLFGQNVHINQLVERVVREARPISTYYYEHNLITGRFRINR